MTEVPPHTPTAAAGPPLEAYLLGELGFDDLLALQARMAYEATGDGHPAVIFCDHPAGVTLGRDGSAGQVRWAAGPVRWLARGGGAVLHAPGQVACYPVFPLDRLRTPVQCYLETLTRVVAGVVAGFGAVPVVTPGDPGVRIGARKVAHVGVSVRNSVTGFGVVVNVHPDLERFRAVRCDGDLLPMTSLQRECPVRVRPQAVRQRLLEALTAAFGFGRVSVFHNHPTLARKSPFHALAFRDR